MQEKIPILVCALGSEMGFIARLGHEAEYSSGLCGDRIAAKRTEVLT